MKTLGKIKLDQFAKSELDKNEMNAIRGGGFCNCWCTCHCDNAYVVSPLARVGSTTEGGFAQYNP